MPKPSRTYLLLQDRLGQDLDAYVRECRATGSSWHTIASELNVRTGVPVTPETIRLWFLGVERGARTDEVAS